MWYNGGPVAGDSARVLPIGSICKIFVQSSRLSYGFSFSRNLALQSNFIFKPPLTHISNFIWHMAHSTSVQLTKFQLLIANLLRCRSGPVFHIKTRGKIIRAENQLIRSGPQLEDYSPALFLLIFIIKYVIILKKDIKIPRFQLKITKNETKQRKNLSFLT